MMRKLTPRPRLEQLNSQARDLCKEHQSAPTEAVERIRANLPKFSAASADEILHGECSLQEAQHVIAGEYGCKHWVCAVATADLNVLAGLRDVHIQDVLREIDQQDCTRALTGAGSIVRWRLPSNMSMRVRGLLEWPTGKMGQCNSRRGSNTRYRRA